MAAGHGKFVELVLLGVGGVLLPRLSPRGFEPFEQLAIAPGLQHGPAFLLSALHTLLRRGSKLRANLFLGLTHRQRAFPTGDGKPPRAVDGDRSEKLIQCVQCLLASGRSLALFFERLRELPGRLSFLCPAGFEDDF